MAMILVSLQSPQSRAGGLGILDPSSGLRYLQVDTPSPLVKNSQPRGVALARGRIYVNTAASVRFYQVDDRIDKPLLKLEKEVILNEWLLGGPMQANLMSIVASEQRNRLYIGNNNFCAIDELDMDGSFISRQHLWEIAPDIFPLPRNLEHTVDYGFIRSLCLSPAGILCITVTNCNNSGAGKVISLDSGEELLAGLNDPCDGLFVGDRFYLHDIDQGKYMENKNSGKLYAYSAALDREVINAVQWAVRPEIVSEEYKQSVQNLRGMAFTENTVFSGVSHYGKAEGLQIPPRIVAIDAATGQQRREYPLPNLTVFREPRVFFMTPLADNFSVHWNQDLHFFLHDQPSTPEFHREEKKEEVKVSQASSADAATQKVPRTAGTDREPSEPERLQERKTEAGDSPDSGSGGPAKSVSTPASGSPGRTEKAAGARKEPVVVNKEESDEHVRWVDSVKGTEEARVPSVILENVSLNYRRTASFALFSPNKRLGKATDFLAIDHVSFTLYEDETVGIIGRNGSGKSTISMIISGALPPDAGRVKVNGKVQLLALAVGFRPELTGRENVYISGTLLGMTRRQLTARMGDIEEFAELGEFFDEPLRIYSSGMRSRLGFAVATTVNPDILILDEVMSTGDAAFRNKADQRMKAMRQRTKTVLMVSHSAEQVKNICSRVVWLEKGRLVMDGPAVPVLAEYTKFCKNPGKWLEKHAAGLSSGQGG